MPPGTTFVYLPDGRGLYAPEDVIFYGEGERVAAKQFSHAVGQIGLWYAAPALFQGFTTAAATLVSATWTSLPLQTEMIDGYDMHSTSTSTSNVFPPSTGNTINYASEDFYLVIGYVPLNTGGTGGQKLNIAGVFNNFDGVIYEGMKIPTVTGHAMDPMVVDILITQPDGSTNVYYQLTGWQDTGVNVNTVVSGKSASLTVRWMSGSRVYNTIPHIPISPHTLIPEDQLTADATGASPVSPGVKVPVNDHIFNSTEWYNATPFARVTSGGSSQTIASSTSFTAVQMTFGNFDPWNMWTSGANTKLTVGFDGLYLVIGQVGTAEATGATGSRAVRLQVNSDAAKIYGGNTSVPATTDTTGHALAAVYLIQMSAGDFVEVQYMQNGGASRAVRTGTGDCCKLLAQWICA
jgi:hypothetical protein